MYDRLETRVYLIGTLEAVSEGAMHLWRSTAVDGKHSQGIRALGEVHKNLFAFDMACNVLGTIPGEFAESTSRRLPGLLVGVSVGGSADQLLPEHQCFWGASAYIDGVEVVSGLTGSREECLPPHLAEQVDSTGSAGALPLTALPELHELAASHFIQAAEDRLVSRNDEKPEGGGMPVPGFPRWSLLTHAVNASGLPALREFDASVTKAYRQSDALVMQAAHAFGHGLAGWPDTLFNGSRTPASDRSDTAPYSSDEVDAWRERAFCVLRELSADETGFGTRVLEALAHPSVSFQDGTFVGSWLATLRPTDEKALIGLRKIASHVGSTMLKYEDDVYASAKAAIAASGYMPEAFDMAARMNKEASFSHAYLVAQCLNSADPSFDHASVANKLFDCLVPYYGSVSRFPDEVAETFLDAHPAVASAFEAMKTEEQMRATLSSWSGAHRAHAPVSVVVKRRRQQV